MSCHLLLSLTFLQTNIHSSTTQYIGEDRALNWQNSDDTCLWKYCTHLASIHNATQNIVALNARTSSVDNWIGLNDINNENNFEWTDSSNWDYGINTNGGNQPWDEPNEPNNANNEEHCVEIKNDARWNDNNCDIENKFICNEASPIYIFNDNYDYQRIPSIGHIIGYIDILDEIHIEFEFILNEFELSDQWSSVLAIEQKDIEFYIDNWNQILYIEIDTVSNTNHQYSVPIIADTFYHFDLFMSQTQFILKIHNITSVDEVIGSHSILMNRAIYLSDDVSVAANASIIGLKISTSNSHYPNPFNYLCDYYDRFTVNTGSWDYDENSCELTCDTEASGSVVWLGDMDTTTVNWTDYKVEAVVELLGGDGNVGILFRSLWVDTINDGGQQYEFSIKQIASETRFAEINDGNWNRGTTHDKNFNFLQNYRLRVDVKGNQFSCYIGDKLRFVETDSSYKHGSIGLRVHGTTAIWKSLRIIFPTDKYLITVNPTTAPTVPPVMPPSNSPSQAPASAPSVTPTTYPSGFPSKTPSMAPSLNPTIAPTKSPQITEFPTNTPSLSPSNAPTNIPSLNPTSVPTEIPTKTPTENEHSVDETSTTVTEDGPNDEDRKNQDDKNVDSLTITAISLSAVIVILGAALFICFVYVKKRKRKKIETVNGIDIEIANIEGNHNDIQTNICENNNNDDDDVFITPMGIPIHRVISTSSGMDLPYNDNNDQDADDDENDDLYKQPSDELQKETPQNLTVR